MFDISKITANATIEAVRRFVYIELTRDWSYKRESINSHDSIKEIMRDSKQLYKMRRSSQVTILKRVYILEVNTRDSTTTKENF